MGQLAKLEMRISGIDVAEDAPGVAVVHITARGRPGTEFRFPNPLDEYPNELMGKRVTVTIESN